MGSFTIIGEFKKGIKLMSSEKVSQELLTKLEDRLEVVNMSINEYTARSSYYLQQVNAIHMQTAITELITEKAKLIVQISAITRFLRG